MIFALDASVVLAVIFDEPGGRDAIDLLSDGVMSSVNFSEVMARCLERGVESELAERQLSRLNIDIVPFSVTEARLAAKLRKATRHRGLSLGDRACLALAEHRGISALTADRQWNGLEVGVAVQLIR
jgi:ribonuclease VapC